MRKSVFDVIEGFKPVDPAALEPFHRAMTEEVIPEIARAIWRRQELARVSRHWRIG
jgi:hypothetical protein